MSSIMKGIVDEGDWTGGIINWKKEVTSKHGPDVTFKKRKLPGVNGKTDTYATNNQGKVVGVYQHHNDMGRVLSETDAIKGADGKRCWKGKRYAGTENGKDKCIPVKNEAANPAQQAAIAIAKKKKAKTNEGVFDLLKKKPAPRDTMRERLSNMSTDELRQELKDYKSRLSGARASGSLVGAAVSDYINALKTEIDKRAFNDFSANTNEGVIVGHDKDDPEVAILGGAGTMSLSRLKKKAHGEALQLADDIANGKYNASSYNMKQLHNTLNTIVAAEEEMKKSYFGEDYTGEFAAEKTSETNPYGGLKDIQHRGAISETPTDNITGASGEGGWRKYKPKSAGTLKEGTDELKAFLGKYPEAIDAMQNAVRHFEYAYDAMDHVAGHVLHKMPYSEWSKVRQDFIDYFVKYGLKADVNEEQLDEKCWTGYKQVGMKKKGDKMVPNCVAKESAIMKGLRR